jgi:hypothetical protein
MITSLTLAGEFPENVTAWIQHWSTEPAPVGTVKLEPIPEASPVLAHPYFAERNLEGDAWAAWAIAHNRAQAGSGTYEDQLIQGRTTQIKRQSGQTTIITTPNRYRRVYTGPPLVIYNPYAKRTNQ